MKDSINDYKISRLIAKKLAGTLSPEEEVRLQAWLEADPQNLVLYDRIARGEKVADRELYLSRLDVDDSWNTVRKQMTRGGGRLMLRKRYFLWRGVAASILLLFCLGVYWSRFYEKEESVYSPVAEVVTGGFKAVLITGNGQAFELQDSTNREICVGGEMVALNNRGEVSYSGDSITDVTGGVVEYNTLRVPRGGEYRITLSDNTKVFLNADSEIRYPVKFGKGKRIIFLQGEAFFEVTKDASRPFIVQVKDELAVEVLGTRFNVQAYSDDISVKTTLNDGRVRVYDERQSVELHPDQQAVYSKGNKELVVRDVDAGKFSAWKDGRLILSNNSMEEILTCLARWYNVNVFWVNSEVKNYHFTGELARYENFSEILQMLEKATKVRFEVKDRTIFVYKL